MAITPTRRTAGWQTTSQADLARIQNRYRPPQATYEQTARNFQQNFPEGATSLPMGYDPPTPTRQPTAAEPSAIDTAPMAKMAAGATPPPGNAAQRWRPDAQPEWMQKGGSERTFNRANAARGIRPEIDARATPSPRNSTASDAIRAQWAQRNPAWSKPALPY